MYKQYGGKRPSSRVFKSSSSRDTIVNCIADLEGSPERDYSNCCIDLLYHTTLRFAETFELDESVISLISEARDMVFECHIDNELLNTLVCPQLFTGYPGRPKFEIPKEILRFLFDKRFTVTETATLLGVSQLGLLQFDSKKSRRFRDRKSFIKQETSNLFWNFKFERPG